MAVKKDKVGNVPNLRFPGFEGEWRTRKLGQITSWSSGGTPSKENPLFWNGDIPWISASSMRGIVYSNSEFKITQAGLRKGSKLAQKGTLLILVRGSMLFNKIPIGVVSGDVAFNQDVKSIVVNDYSSSEYILNWFMAFESRVLNMVSGTGIGAGKLDLQDLKALEIKIPSLLEQRKITSFLSLLNERIETQSKIIGDLEIQFKSLVVKLFYREIKFKDNIGNNYPKWEIEKLGNIATFRRGSFPQPYGLPKWYDQDEGFPFVQVFDVGENMRLKNTTKNKISQLATEQSVFVKKGSLIITIQGSIGRVAKTHYDAYVDRTLLIFQSYKRDINIDYFKYAIFLLFEIEKEKAPGGIIKTITKEVLTQFTVSIPSYDEQRKIAEALALMESKLEVEKNILSNYEDQKQYLLSNLFI